MTTKANKIIINLNLKKMIFVLFGRESAGVPKFIHKKSIKNKIKMPYE